MALLEARGLSKRYGGGAEVLRSVDLCLDGRRSVGLVGESGCGKTTLARCLLRLTPITAGQLLFEGREISRASRRQLAALRRAVQPVFQDPQASFNPQLCVSRIIEEALVIHRRPGGDRQLSIAALLDRVGLDPDLAPRFVHQLSAGQRQRLAIARALAVEPRMLIADEPLSALDPPVQAQILNLMLDLQQAAGMSYLFISHDLRAVHHLCHEVAVLYLGRLVERAPARVLRGQAHHPYTRALVATGLLRQPAPLPGEPPVAANPPPGCPFHPRCPRYQQRRNNDCTTTMPPLREERGGHWVACHDPCPPAADVGAFAEGPE